MEADQCVGGVNQPSGIPRPSRLPVLRNRSFQVFLRKEEDALLPSEQSHATPNLEKRKSIASLTRPTQNGSKAPNTVSKPFPPKSHGRNDAKHSPKNSSASRFPTLRPSSRGNQQQKPSASSTKIWSYPEDEENQDQLSSLESFRSASRPGSRDGSLPETIEFVESTELPSAPERKKSARPSLSDRTIDSIQNLPSTPKDRRRSSFFSPVESPMGPPPRPKSSLSHSSSNGGSRPGTSDGSFAKPPGRPTSTLRATPLSVKPASRTSLGGFGFTPSRSVSSSSKNIRQEITGSVPVCSRLPSPSTISATAVSEARSLKAPLTGKISTGKQSKPRPALSDAFGPAVGAGAVADREVVHKRSRARAATPETSTRVASNLSNPSSTALRQQIAAAKAAVRKEKAKRGSDHDIPLMEIDKFEADLHLDPFSQAPRDATHILHNRINAARMDGKLNIAALGLKNVPDAVLKMYDSAAVEESKVNWAEVVDLTRFNAADNEIGELGDNVFPDISAEDLALDDQTNGNQFGGLETLDLHGNGLQSLPMGVRRLERLTTLNLAHNRLENNALDVICQISALKNLNLGHNAFSGHLPETVCCLQNLEVLDIQANRLLGLPEAVRELVSLRVLNVSGNQLTALPMEAIQELGLTELDASSNALMGALFPLGGSDGHPNLQTLKIANNSLAALTFSETLNLPRLRTLDVTNNRLAMLPPISGWLELITLTAGDNKISELPKGFETLSKLRNVNFTNNELRLLDPAIARMDSLETLILASNPLREKKFLTMSAGDVKRDLKRRLEPLPAEEDNFDDQDHFRNTRGSLSPQALSTPTSSWVLKTNATLDLTGRGLSDDINDSLGSFLKANEVKQLQLSSNKMTAVPPALWLGQDLKVLDLSANPLGSIYLSDELELPSLQELNISQCGITTLEPMMTQLHAPNLQTLDITQNRLSGPLPTLRELYPALTTLLARDNRFTFVTAESLRGLQTVNLSSNDIEQLPAEVGLLWDQGLRSLEIGSNAFRVPNYRVLEKGTEAILRYLRDRIPAVDDKPMVNGVACAVTELN